MNSPHARTSSNDISPVALAGAAGAALVGALAWAAISYVTEYEIGYMAWGVGLLVGLAAVRLGGRGAAVGVAAAVLTLVSIFAGKLFATQLLVEKHLTAGAEETFSRAFYDEMRSDAEAWGDVGDASDEDAVRLFMVERAYVESDDPSEVTRAELAQFRSLSIPELERLADERPSFEQWRDRAIAETRSSFAAENSTVGLVASDLNLIDLVFAVLAVSTAFGLVARAGGGPQDGDAASGSGQYRRAA